jgi:peptidyl-prolyl cis-trans isomerase D
MSFEEAKAQVEKAWRAQAREAALQKEAKALEKDPARLTKESDYVSLSRSETLPPLDAAESAQFLQKLFTSNVKVGTISINKKLVVYKIVKQKFGEGDANLSAEIARSADRIKRAEFEGSLLKELSQKYPVKSFVKGF